MLFEFDPICYFAHVAQAQHKNGYSLIPGNVQQTA